MKSIFKQFIFILSLSFVLYSCAQQDNQKEDEQMNEDKTFQSPEDAADKAKRDLIELLETREDLNMQIDVERLRNSETARLIRYAVVDFSRLLGADSVKSLSEISSEKSMIAPFVADNRVVAVAEVGKVEDGWKVIGLGNPAVSNDLNSSGLMADKNKNITLYEVPNLQLFIYGLREDNEERYFLDFENFTMREGVPVSAFFPLVKERASRFQSEFGDQLKKENLVK